MTLISPAANNAFALRLVFKPAIQRLSIPEQLAACQIDCLTGRRVIRLAGAWQPDCMAAIGSSHKKGWWTGLSDF